MPRLICLSKYKSILIAIVPLQNVHQIKLLHICAQVGSFTEAANVLGCSQSAVSQSIRQIEARLGFPVFNRSGKGINLTPSGARFLKTLEASWGHIEKSAITERRSASVRTVRLCAPPSFTLNWLLPRMPRFYAAHKTIHVELEVKENIFHTDESDADVVISYWNYDRPPFLDDALFPVCAPEFATAHDLEAAMDTKVLIQRLPGLPLIGEDIFPFGTRIDAWAFWSQSFDMDLRNVSIRRHALSHISLKEAEYGLGVGMARSTLVDAALARGALLCLSKTSIASPYRFFLPDKVASPEAQDVCDWLKQEADDFGVGPHLHDG